MDDQLGPAANSSSTLAVPEGQAQAQSTHLPAPPTPTPVDLLVFSSAGRAPPATACYTLLDAGRCGGAGVVESVWLQALPGTLLVLSSAGGVGWGAAGPTWLLSSAGVCVGCVGVEGEWLQAWPACLPS